MAARGVAGGPAGQCVASPVDIVEGCQKIEELAAKGSTTPVVLGELAKGGSLPNALFDIDANTKKRGGR